MVTSPDGMGIIIVGGYNQDSKSGEKRILESRFDGSKFLPWQVMDQELEYGMQKYYGEIILASYNLLVIWLFHLHHSKFF